MYFALCRALRSRSSRSAGVEWPVLAPLGRFRGRTGNCDPLRTLPFRAIMPVSYMTFQTSVAAPYPRTYSRLWLRSRGSTSATGLSVAERT